MKIRQHPRMQGIGIGDEVYCLPRNIFARVIEVFPAAVCVRVGVLSVAAPMELAVLPQLWRADDIENLSICRFCGSRDDLDMLVETGVPFRVCTRCRGIAAEQGVQWAGHHEE